MKYYSIARLSLQTGQNGKRISNYSTRRTPNVVTGALHAIVPHLNSEKPTRHTAVVGHADMSSRVNKHEALKRDRYKK